MQRMLDPFVILGLDQGVAKTEDVNAAFRKLALSCHPDKNPDASNAAEEFTKLKDARDRALVVIENQNPQANSDAENPMVNWAVSWMSRMTYEIAKNQEAKPVEVDIVVSLSDVYHARTKKVVISVLRADSGEPFKRTRQDRKSVV